MNEYVLFCSQEANFQTRSILIPVEDITSELEEMLNILDMYSRPFKARIEGEEYIINKMLTTSSIWDINCGSTITTPFTNAAGQLEFIACEGEGRGRENGPFSRSGWDRNAIRPIEIRGGFDHITNFVEYMNIKEYDGEQIVVIDGYLVLEGEQLPMDEMRTIELEPFIMSGKIMTLPRSFEGEWIDPTF